MKGVVKAIVLILSTSCLSAVNVPSNHLVSSGWLKQHVGDSSLVVIDTRSKWMYKRGHIKGALSYPKNLFFQGREGNIKGLPASELKIQEILQKAGASSDTAVVFYNGGKKPKDFAGAASALWNFWLYGFENVALLDGGFKKWKLEHKVISKKIPIIKRSDFLFYGGNNERSSMALLSDVVDALSDDSYQIVDARSSRYFKGKAKRKGFARHGHIVHSRLLPIISLIKRKHHYYTFASSKRMKSIFKKKVNLENPMIVYCNSGFHARGLWFISKFLMKVRDVQVYDAGMLEYSRSKYPIEKGR